MGHCGIPPLLVQRYSEELRQDVETMSVVLEHLREKQLRNLGRPCVSLACKAEKLLSESNEIEGNRGRMHQQEIDQFLQTSVSHGADMEARILCVWALVPHGGGGGVQTGSV